MIFFDLVKNRKTSSTEFDLITKKGQKRVRKASEKGQKRVRKASEKRQKRVRKASEKRQKSVSLSLHPLIALLPKIAKNGCIGKIPKLHTIK